MSDILRIDPSWLPATPPSKVEFLDSSFFKIHGATHQLPTPAEVRALAGPGQKRPRPRPVRFEMLGLLVKFGSHVTVYEAQCLIVIKKLFGDSIPVPEVFGWRVHDGVVFIYMQLIQGVALIDQWDSLSILDKNAVCDQLRGIVISLRSVRQISEDVFIGISWHPKANLRQD